MSTFTRRFVLPVGFLCIIGAFAAWYWTQVRFGRPSFEATARFQMRENERDEKGETHKQESSDVLRQRLEYAIAGRPALENLVRDIGLTKDIPHTADGSMTTDGLGIYEELLQRLGRNITVEVEIDSPELKLVAVTVRDTDGRLATKLANKAVENYMSKRRSEMDEMLLDQKKYFEQEFHRYRRKVSELESSRRRSLIALAPLLELVPDLDIASDKALSIVIAEPARRRKVLAVANLRLERLKELTKDKPTGDQVIIEMARLQVDIEEAQTALKAIEHDKRDWVAIRDDLLKIDRELAESRTQLQYWTAHLAESQMALTLAVSERGSRILFVQRAPEYLPELKRVK